MSWFKRSSSVREDSQTVNGRNAAATRGRGGRDRSGTDPETCFEVFKNHWQQAVDVIGGRGKGPCSSDDVETVVHNFEQMMTLLVGEESVDGMPGPIVYFMLEKEVLELFCNWCGSQSAYQEKLCLDQLRMYELLISQSRQLLLIHRQIIRPLLRLLMACAEPQDGSVASEELEFRLVLVLHHICTCVSQETAILDSFFSGEGEQGRARFPIFSLLIPYIHREGPIGQRARDALLLLMTLSAIHPHIGNYIAQNSDFCPVLATGLSGLYSSLPRKIVPPSEDWYALTDDDCQSMVDLQMFLNSLEFCNAVVQVAHPLVRDQLIQFIYSGFLQPVLGPALHQDISGLPVPLLDTAMFVNSRDEVMTATAYLDLFLRRISEPHLLRAFLRFVLTERHDEMPVLDSLITRINSNTKLCLVSLSLFQTLVDLNCEEVMFQLVFKYLIPCTHVMVSQRRAVRDVDLYGKSADKFLSLRPACCALPPTDPAPAPPTSSPAPSPAPQAVATAQHLQQHGRPTGTRSASISSPAELPKLTRKTPGRRSLFRSRKDKKQLETLPESEQKPPSDSSSSSSVESTTPNPQEGLGVKVRESSYAEYLWQARWSLECCGLACSQWSAPYDGESPPPDADLEQRPHVTSNPPTAVVNGDVENSAPKDSAENSAANPGGVEAGSEGSVVSTRTRSGSSVQLLSHGNVPRPGTVPSSSGDVPMPSTPSSQPLSSVPKPSPHGVSPSLPSSYAPVVSHSGKAGGSGGGGDLDTKVKDRQNSPPATGVCNSDSPSYAAAADCDAPSPPPNSQQTQSVSSSFSSSSSSLSSSSLPVVTFDLAKLHACLNSVDSFLAFLNSDVEVTAGAGGDSPSAEDSAKALEDLMARVTLEGRGSRVSKAHDPSPTFGRHDDTSTLGNKPAADSNATVSIAATATTTTTLVSSRTKAPPRTLGLPSTAKDTPQIGKLPTLTLRTPDAASMAMSPSSPGFLLSPSVTRLPPPVVRYSSGPPNIGPFLGALFGRLEGMVQNSLYTNLLLTGLVSRLAAFPQPLLRSFLLNVNLVFQPSVKSLVQVLSSVRQKVDSFAMTTTNFAGLIPKARLNLQLREDSLLFPTLAPLSHDLLTAQGPRSRAATTSTLPTEKKKLSLADLLFRRSPKQRGQGQGGQGQGQQLQRLSTAGGGVSYRFINSPGQGRGGEGGEDSLKTWNAVYCALILEEFLKELAALSLEHSVLSLDEGYISS